MHKPKTVKYSFTIRDRGGKTVDKKEWESSYPAQKEIVLKDFKLKKNREKA